MAVFLSKDKKEMIVSCKCHCGTAAHITIDKEDPDMYCFLTYMNGNFYRDQDDKLLRVIERKLKKIWCIIRNKDFYYSDIIMKREEFEQFKEYINEIE